MEFFIEEENLKKITPFTKRYKKKEIIFSKGDVCEGIAIVLKGEIEAISNAKTIRMLKRNDVIGLSLIFTQSPIYRADFIVESNTAKIQFISKEELRKLMYECPAVSERIVKYISDYSLKQAYHLTILSCKFIRTKICTYLFYEYKKHRTKTFDIRFTKTELASYLNTERPSLSTEISKLCKEGIISNNNKTYSIIDIERLEKESLL